MALLNDHDFDIYKKRMIPVLYDWFMHYHLKYPTQTCRWGPKVEELPYKTRYRAYLSEQGGDDRQPNTLILAHIDVLKPHVASCEAVSNWTDASTNNAVHTLKTIYHPGEVNKVRELPTHPELLVTHTDAPELYVWSVDRQPDRRPAPGGGGGGGGGQAAAAGSAGKRARGADRAGGGGGGGGPQEASTPDLTLVGHEADAPFPLAVSAAAPAVASGGEDTHVLLWDLADSVGGLVGPAAGGGGGGRKAPELQARVRMEGHTKTVDDLVFQPGSAAVLVSVADDGAILTWDVRDPGARKGGGRAAGAGGAEVVGPVARRADAHGPGLNVMCVDWCPLDEHALVTGANDGSLCVWDRRRMEDALHFLRGHRNARQRDIIHVEWHPTCKDVFASGSEDHTVAIWNLAPDPTEPPPPKPRAPSASTPTAAGAGTAAAAAGGKGGGEGGGGEGDKGKGAKPRGGKEGAAAASGAASGAPRVDELPRQLMFQHLGHRYGRVTDFQWHPSEPWTIISVSDNSGAGGTDGSLQVWRIMDLLYRPYKDALEELERHKQFVLQGVSPLTSVKQEKGDKPDKADKAEKQQIKQEAKDDKMDTS